MRGSEPWESKAPWTFHGSSLKAEIEAARRLKGEINICEIGRRSVSDCFGAEGLATRVQQKYMLIAATARLSGASFA